MELVQVANYLVGRYLVSDRKKDKMSLLKGELLAACSVDSLGKSKTEVVYYDTQDFFFADKGINIYTVQSKSNYELIIRYDSDQVQRIEFLKNTPNFFKLKITNKVFNIMSFAEQIDSAIYKVFPEGLHVNIEDMLRQSRPQVRINKKNEEYRVVNNKGLKTTISFAECTYVNLQNRSSFSQNNMEVTGESTTPKDMFDTFLKYIIVDCPQLIRITNNELTLARKNF